MLQSDTEIKHISVFLMQNLHSLLAMRQNIVLAVIHSMVCDTSIISENMYYNTLTYCTLMSWI